MWNLCANEELKQMERADSLNVPKEAIQVAAIARELLSPVGIYLYGSAVHGGLQERSDVDVLVVLSQRLTAATRQAFLQSIMAVSRPLGNREGIHPLEVTVVNQKDLNPWQHPAVAELQYGEWLRDRIESGWIPKRQQNADLTILLYQVRDKSTALFGPPAPELLPVIPLADVKCAIQDSLHPLVGYLVGDERNVLLTLARMWQTVTLGCITPKDVAAQWAISRMPAAYGDLLRLAAEGYRGESKDEWEQQPELNNLVAYLVQAIESTL